MEMGSPAERMWMAGWSPVVSTWWEEDFDLVRAPGRMDDLEGFVSHGWAQRKATAGGRLPCGEGRRPLQQQGACFLQRMCFRPSVCDDLGSDWVVFSPSCVKKSSNFEWIGLKY